MTLRGDGDGPDLVAQKFYQMDAAALSGLRLDMSRVFTVLYRLEDGQALIAGRMSDLEHMVSANSKLLLQLVGKLEAEE